MSEARFCYLAAKKNFMLKVIFDEYTDSESQVVQADHESQPLHDCPQQRDCAADQDDLNLLPVPILDDIFSVTRL